jgi:uncharacterized protein YjeT (DUF2065 family)
MSDLWSALALVAILEGLFLFAAPGAWKRAVERLHALPDHGVRRVGAALLIAGLLSLWLVRGG